MTIRDEYSILTGIVTNNIDPYGGQRIQVRLGNVHDGDTNDSNLIYCTPLMPKLVHIIPKPGELVAVFLQRGNSSKGNRFYIGPILSQPQRYYHELSTSSQAFMDNPDGSDNLTLEDPDKGENKGTIPSVDDIAILGRDNADIILKDDEIRIRCGLKRNSKASVDENLKFNKVDPAFIQMQWKKRTDSNSKNYSSSINLYADRINLLSRNGDVNIGELDNEELISEEKMTELLDKCHPLVYGDVLVSFLKQFVTTFLNHTHPYSMLTPVLDSNVVNISNTNFNGMLSKSVKTC